METIVDRIRALCRQKRTSITKIEEELGYANGTIGKWAKGKKPPPLEKIMAIAEKLDCSVSYLQTGEEQKEKPTSVSTGGQAEKLAKALGDIGIDVDSLSESEINRIARLAKAALDE